MMFNQRWLEGWKDDVLDRRDETRKRWNKIEGWIGLDPCMFVGKSFKFNGELRVWKKLKFC